MSISYDKAKKRYRWEFKKVIADQQHRLTKLLPAGFTREQAEKYDKERTEEIYASLTGIRERLIDDAVLLYCKEHCTELKRGDEVIAQLKRDYKNYTGLTISQFPEAAANIRKEPVSAGTKRNRIAYIRAALRYAHQHHNFPAPPSTPPISVKNQRHFYLSRKDMLKVCLKTRRKDVRAIIRIAFYSGLRQGEILRCREQNGLIVVHDTKNGTSHAVPVHPKITSAVKLAPFGIPQNTLKVYVRESLNAAGYKDYRFHDLRHSAASAMIQAGVSLYTVGAVLNHQSQSSTRRYAHLTMKNLQEAVRSIR